MLDLIAQMTDQELRDWRDSFVAPLSRRQAEIVKAIDSTIEERDAAAWCSMCNTRRPLDCDCMLQRLSK